ncbi:MAG: hypothetical protein V4689_12870 [Verrucomicrobiota bacterium]
MKPLQKLRSHLRRGKVYRREDLAKWSTSVDRHLKELVESGELNKLSGGVYYCPKQTAFGDAPAEDDSLIAAFLKDTRFLLTSPNAYNALGVGSTQLYNETIVYNHKRHGQFNLGGRVFDFRVKPSFPKASTREFLLVDLVNNIDRLAENRREVLDRVKKLATDFDAGTLLRAAHRYGSVRTRKFFDALETEGASLNAR